MSDKAYSARSVAAARELAAVTAAIRAAYPGTKWRCSVVPDVAHIDAPKPDRLPEIMAMYREDTQIADIADRIGLSPLTVRDIIHKARRDGRWPEELRRRP